MLYVADHLKPDLKLFAVGVCRVQGRPLGRPVRASSLFSAVESGMVRRAVFDLPGEPGPSVRRPPEPSTWARRTALKQPAQHARGLPGACFPRLQTMGARPYLSAGHRSSGWGVIRVCTARRLMADGCYAKSLGVDSLQGQSTF